MSIDVEFNSYENLLELNFSAGNESVDVEFDNPTETIDVKFEDDNCDFEVGFSELDKSLRSDFGEVQTVEVPVETGGTQDHRELTNRDEPNQHPIGAITGLKKALEEKQPVGKYVTETGMKEYAQPKGAYLTKETDPTVPEWAKRPEKPTYTAKEVGALPDTTQIPSLAGYATENWVKNYAETIGASEQALREAQTYSDRGIALHNTDPEAHNDIRLIIQNLLTKVNDLLDSDDATLDQMSEVVAYIKANREVIESVTISKVSVVDIIDNLITNVADKPLSAAQGVELKRLIDNIEIPTIPTKVSAFENDAGYLTEHQDISGKLDKDKLPEAINDALAQAKESGEFDGEDGQPGKDGRPGADGYTPKRGTDYWTDVDKTEIVQQAKSAINVPTKTSELINDSGFLTKDTIGKMYKGAWIAESCTGISQHYTEIITLPAGTYVVNVVAPYCSDLTARVCIGFSAKMSIGSGNTFIDAAYGAVTMVATFTTTTNLCVVSAASNNSATWGYLDRGGIAAVRIV